MVKWLCALALAVLSGCRAASMAAPVQVQSYIPIHDSAQSCGSGYVYVADGKARSLLVYCFGFPDSPIRSVSLDGSPFQPAVSQKTGRVYVTEMQVNEVAVLDRGANNRLELLNDVSAPGGITVVGGKVYVAERHVSGPQELGAVVMYDEGSPDIVATYPAPNGWGALGVAVDKHGNRYETLINAGAFGMLVKYAPGASGENYTFITQNCRPCWGGVTIDDNGDVTVGDYGALTTFNSQGKRVYSRPAPAFGILTYFTHSELGTFVPINDGDDLNDFLPANERLFPLTSGKSEVYVYPESGAIPFYVLKQGMETPLGAAGGK